MKIFHKRDHENPAVPYGTKALPSVVGDAFDADMWGVWEDAPVGIHFVDSQGKIIWANRTELKMLGYTREEYFGRHIAEFHVDSDVIDDLLQRLQQRAPVDEYEVRLRHKDGSIRHGTLNSNVLWKDGEFVHTRCFTRDVTERKSLADTSAEQFSELESIYHSAPIGLAVIDNDFRFVRVNERLAALNGVPVKLHIGRHWRDVVPMLAEQAEAVFRQVMQTGEPVLNVEVEGETPAQPGVRRMWNQSWHPLKDARGATVGVNVVAEEITERKRAEATLREREHHFRQMIDALPVAIYTTDAQGRLTHFNPAAVEFSGHKPELGTDKWCVTWKLYWPDGTFLPHAECPMAISLKEGRSVRGAEAIAERPDGTRRWFQPYPTPLRDASGRVVGGINMLVDITERKQTEQRFAHLAAIVDSSSDAILSKTLQGIITSWNGGAQRIFGYTAEEMIGQSILKLIPPERRSEEDEIIARLKAGERIDHYETVRATKDGRRIFVSLTISPVKDANGKTIGASKIARDITERKRVEEALRLSEERLKEADRRKDEFLAMLAHELRNPLAPIVNAVNLLRHDTGESKLQQQARSIIERQTARLARLVDDLMEVSRITTGRIRLHSEQVTIDGIIDRAVETVRPLIEQRRHTLTVLVPPEPMWLHADAARLEQVVVNLLNNAAKYTDEGGRIDLVVHSDGHNVVVQVRDTGIGIEPAVLPRIFDLFTQADGSLDRAQGGLGIGLAVVKRLIAMHGGTITAKSTVGQGSEFTVRLPMAPVPAQGAHDETVAAPKRSVDVLRILVVDDNLDAAQSMAALLSISGHNVRLAHDGLAAIDVVAEHCPHVVFLDIGLPKLNGYDVAKRVRSDASLATTRLVAMTGYGQSGDQQRALAAGFDQHLTKPVDYAQVEAVLAQLLPRT